MSDVGRRVCFDKSRYIVYEPYRGLHLAYHAKRFCFSRLSKYQQIDIIDNEAYGRMLFLDHNLQHTAYDARIFNEALCGPAIRNRVRRIIVLGGGSGQTLLALLESKALKHVTLVEIDEVLIESCRRFVEGVNRAFRDPRVEVRVGDAFSYLHSTNEQFDAAIIDLTEKPLHVRKVSATLAQLYADIRAKCGGRCSQYVGSSVGLARSRQLRSVACVLSTKMLAGVRFEDVFIPSFGAPHTFIHAGYGKGPTIMTGLMS
jgi:predicted membrane-bound spermidine synthase